MTDGTGPASSTPASSTGRRIRVLISYGEYWIPWYMRRLTERPANVTFVLKNLFGG